MSSTLNPYFLATAAIAHRKYERGLARIAAFRKFRTDERDAHVHEQIEKGAVYQAARYDYNKETERLCLGMRLQPVAPYEEVFDSTEKEYYRLLNFVIDNVIKPNPSILAKKLLVFPSREDEHWSAIFVFNAGKISLVEGHGKNQVMSNVLHPCFFRYCSLTPDGTRDVPPQPLLWFLNLAHSYCHHTALDGAPKDGITWIEAFRSASETLLKGTELFPSIRLCDEDELPMQVDRCNCGVGLIATIAIIIRDVIGDVKDQCRSVFDENFARSQLPIEFSEEHFVYLPYGFLKGLPTKTELVWGDYLSVLREEWFLLFDELAELHYVTIPKRVNQFHKQDARYTRVKNDLK